MRYTKSADIGMSLEKDTNINYRYSLPNKLFDYISAGIAVVAGDLPEISRVVTENSCGVIIPSVNPGEIAKAINLLDKNRDLLKVLKQNSLEASEILNWQNESLKVKEFYTKIFS
jgi:glycosyltransferase involved in cell wall biosynthesis